MKNSIGKCAVIWAAVLILTGMFGITNVANAQTKKKTTKKTTKTSSIPKPVSTQTLPVIISQADQYQNQNQLITVETPTQTETQPDTFDEKLDKISNRLKEINTRMKTLESTKQNEYDAKQKRLLLNLDILTRAEQRAESLRKQMFELIEKENTITTKLETIGFDSRPEMIERQVALAGSLRPEELREMKAKNLKSEKRNLESLLTEIQTTRANLLQNVQKADQLVEKLRVILEKDIDEALSDEPNQ